MSDNSKIEWTDATWNPLRARDKTTGKIGWHCEKVSPACKHCYAEMFNRRKLAIGTGLPYTHSSRDQVEILLDPQTLAQPLHWKRPRMIFVCSMTDLFGEFVPFRLVDRMIAVMAAANQHTYQILTKRPERMREYFHGGSVSFTPDVWPRPNLWLGTSVESEDWLHRADSLAQCPGPVRFVSYEPALGPVDFSPWLKPQKNQSDRTDQSDRRIDWVIAGGESGRDGRPAHPDWFRGVRDQCQAAGVPFFFKQWGQWWPKHPVYGETDAVDRFEDPDEHPNSKWVEHTETVLQRNGFQPCGLTKDEHWIHHQPEPQQNPWWFLSAGKKMAGRLLDGRQWNELPKVSSPQPPA